MADIDIQVKLDGIRAVGTLRQLERSLGVIDDKFAKTVKSQEQFSLAVAKGSAQNMNSLSSFARASMSLERQRISALKAEATEQRRLAAIRKKQQKDEQAALRASTSAWQRLGSTIKNAYSNAGIKDAVSKFSIPNIVDQARSAFSGLQSSADLASDMLGYRNALQLALGSQEAASAEMQHAIQLSRDLKLDITVLAKEYSKFSNSMQLAGVTTEKTRKIFEQFAGAARVLNLDAQRTQGMFLALEQMVSKGTVSMEELRRQLGDHLPGALNLAAEAMDYGKGQLRDFMDDVKDGKIVSSELVEKLGELVEMRTKDLVPVSLQKYSANVIAVTNEFKLMKMAIGELSSEFLFNPLLNSLQFVLLEINKLLGPLNMLGSEVKSLTIFSDQLSSNVDEVARTFTTTSDSTADIAKKTQLYTAELTKMQDELDLSVAGFALLGVTGTSLTAMFLAGVKAIGSFAVSVFKMAKSMAGVVAKGFQTAVKWLSRFSALLLATPWGRMAAGIAATGAAIWGLTRALDDGASSMAELEPYSTTLIDHLDQIANKGITPETIISEGAIAAAKTRIENLTGYLAELIKKRDEINNLPSSGNSIVDQIIGVTERVNAGVSPDLISATTTELERLVDVANDPGNFTIEDIGKDGRDAMAAMLEGTGKLMDKFSKTDPIDDFKYKMKGLIDVMEEGVQKDFLNQALQSHLKALRAQQQIAEKEKASRKRKPKEIKNIYEDELRSLDKMQAAQQVRIAGIGKEGTELAILKEQQKHLNREKEIDLAISEKKLSLAEGQALKTQSQNVRDLTIAYTALNEQYKEQIKAKKELEESTKRGQQLLEDALPEQEQYMIWAKEAVKNMKDAGASQEEMLGVLKKNWQEMVSDAEQASMSISEIFTESMDALEGHLSDGFFDVMQGESDDFLKNLADNFKRTVDRMVADALAAELMNAIGLGGAKFPGANIFSMFGGSGGGAGSVVASGVNLGGLGGGATASTSEALLGNLFNFAQGGSFRVGGVGGVDSQLVAFKASPNERVSVTDNKKAQSEPANIYMTVNAQDAGSFNESRDQIVGSMMSAMSQARRNM